jgi:hypothetical protein
MPTVKERIYSAQQIKTPRYAVNDSLAENAVSKIKRSGHVGVLA